MAGNQYVYNDLVINVPDGQSPPAGAIPLGTGGSNSSANAIQFNDPSGGLNSQAFSDAQAQAQTTTGGTLIPVFRDRNLNTTPIGHTDSSANALEHSRGSRRNSSANAVEHGNGPTTVDLPSLLNRDQAITQFGSILADPTLAKSWAQIALEAGLINQDQTMDAVALGAAWTKAVDLAILFKDSSKGSIQLTPFEAAQKVAQNTGSALMAQQAYAAAHFTGDKVSSVQSTTNEQDVPQQTLHDLLGRNPTKGELAAYQHGVASVAKAHPTTTTTTDHYKNGEHISQDNVITGGYDERQAEIDAAYAATPEVAANQQATTYYNALVSALGSAA